MNRRCRRQFNDFFKPEIIRKLKQQNLKLLRQLPDWQQIDTLVESIYNNTITQQDIAVLNKNDLIALLIEDLLGYDFTYHLIVNQKFDLFLNILQQTKSLDQSQLVKLYSSLIKGIIKIKNQANFKIMLSFVKQFKEAMITKENQLSSEQQLNIVVESHFNYTKVRWEAKLLLGLLELIDDKHQKVIKLKETITNLKFKWLIKSTIEERKQQKHLNWKKYVTCPGQLIQILQAKLFDLLINDADDDIFNFEYGYSIYMRMMKIAPYDFLTLYHQRHIEKIKLHLKTQRKNGYNILHCLSENPNQITSEFLDILNTLDLEEEKHQSYFDQIPAVMYLEKAKKVNENFLQFLFGEILTKDYKELEGAQLIMMIYAQQSFKEEKISSLMKSKDYLRRQKRQKSKLKQGRKRKYQVPSKYKKQQAKTLADKVMNENQINLNEVEQQLLQGYCEVNIVHKMLKQKNINHQFPISHYAFPLGHLNLYLSKVEQSLAEQIENPEILDQFIEYLQHEFCSEINQNHKLIIEQLISKLNLNITIAQLIFQRKIMILNSLYKQNKSQKLENIFHELLDQKSDFDQPCFSYTSFQNFQQFLFYNGLISLQQCKNYEPQEWLINFIRYKNYDKQKLLEVANMIPDIDGYPPVQNLIEFYCDSNIIHKFIYQKWFKDKDFNSIYNVNVFRKDIASQITSTEQGINLLLSVRQFDYSKHLSRILFNHNEEIFQLHKKMVLNIIGDVSYQCLTGENQFQLCFYKQSQLKFFFLCQLNGVRIQFIPNKRIKNLQFTCIEEEIVLKQIQQNKSFIQVLLNNDKYHDFLKQAHKFHPEWRRKNTLSYIEEAIKYEAYNNLKFLEEQIWADENNDIIQKEELYKCLFKAFKHENINIYSYGFGVYSKGFKRDEKIFHTILKSDKEKLNRQLKNFFNIFQKVQDYAEENLEYNFWYSRQNYSETKCHILKVLLYYLDDENLKFFEKQIVNFFKIAHPSTIVFYYKVTQNVEQTIRLLQNPDISVNTKVLLRLAKIANEEQLIVYLIEKTSEISNKKILSILVLKYIKQFDDLKYIKQYFYSLNLTEGQILSLYSYFLYNDQIRKAEFILLYLDSKQIQITKLQIRPPKDKWNYSLALSTSWSVGLNPKQFKDIIKHNEFSSEQIEAAIFSIVCSGQFNKLKYISQRIQTDLQLINLTIIAVQNYVQETYPEIMPSIPQFKYDKKYRNQTLTQLHKDQSNFLFTKRKETAEYLLAIVYEREIDTDQFYQNYVYFQLVFPNPKFVFEDIEFSLLDKIIQAIHNKILRHNWEKYLQIFEQTAEYYLKKDFDFTRFYYKKEDFYKELVDIFLSKIEPNFVGTESERILKEVKQLQSKKRTDSIGQERFSKKLSDNYFQGVTLSSINVTPQMIKIYYGQEFDQPQIGNIEELFIALMSKNRYSVNSIMKRLHNLKDVVTENRVIQYLIMYGGQETVIDALKLLGQDVNESLFYYQDIPLLTYIVFKKWYKLYYFAEKYLVEQWSLQPKILNQLINNDINQLTIHQFAQLNQFYVYFALPISQKHISRSSQFLIPNQYNKNLKAFKIYEILTQLFKKIPMRALEIYSLQLESQSDTTYTSLVEALNNLPNSKVSQEILLHTINCENTPFSYLLENYKSEQRHLIKQLLQIFNFEDSKSLTQQSLEDQKKLWQFVYRKFGLYHPVIETLVRISPNEFAGSYILDSPKLSLIVAQFANYQTVMDLANIVEQESCSLRFISQHLVKVTLMIRFGQKFEQLLHNKEFNRIHQQNYIEALNTVNQNSQQGSINIQFMNEMVTLLNITNPSIQIIDRLYNQIKDETNSLKKAFKLLIKIKEFNLQLDIVKDLACFYSDNLYKDFKFTIADKFDLKKEESESIIYLPFEYEQGELEEFLKNVPTHFKDLYIEAIMKKATKRKGFKKKISLNIKFEENNLSPLYNDLRYQIPLLWAQQSPKLLLETSKPYKIYGWLEFNEKIKDENTFVYTQNFLQTANLSQYQNQVLVFFNEKNLHNQAYTQSYILESLDALIRQISLINQIKIQIDIQSFLQLFQNNEKIQKIYNKDLLLFIDAFTNYKTLKNILIEVIGYLPEILELFELNKNKQVLIRFQETSNIGQNLKLGLLLDEYFGFCKPQLSYEEQSLVVTLPVSENIEHITNEDEFLNQLFNLNDLDHFIQQQFCLASISEAKIYRFQFDKFIRQTCYLFQQKSNVEIQVKITNEDILHQIENQNLQDQEMYLRKFKIYFSTMFYEDLIDYIRSQRFNSLYQEKLLSGNLIAKPELLGYLAIHNVKSLQNHFGLLLSKDQFLRCQAKNFNCHVCFSHDDQHQLMFGQYQGTKNGKCQFKKQFKKVLAMKQNILEVATEKISGAIVYYYELPKNCEGQFVFIDNDGKFYLNQDEDIQNKVAPQQSLTQLLQLSTQQYSIVFSKENLNQEQFYFNEQNFRLQNVLEISAIDNVKDYQLKICRINKNQIQIDPKQITLQKNKPAENQIGYTIPQGIIKVKLLTLFSRIIQTESNKESQIPPENSILGEDKREEFIQYCKQMKGGGENPIRVGKARQDEFIFYNILNLPITKPVESLNINCYFQHEKFDEIVYHPVITQKNKSYYFDWAPTIKGLYNIFINGHKLSFQLVALAAEASNKEFRIKKQVPEAQYFNKIEFQLELFDIYGNLVQKRDEPIQHVTAISKNPLISIKQGFEYLNDHCSVQLTLCNFEKMDNETDVCELEFQLAGRTLIQKVEVLVQPKTLTYDRIQNFIKQFRYSGTSQFLISRQSFIGNIQQFTNFREQKKLKISFYEELAQDQGGPTREFFELLGKELKSQEHKLFKSTSINPNFYFFDTEIAKNTCYGYVVGVLVAYAIANNQKIGISFALPFWKALCSFPIEFKDLQYIIEPQEYKNYLSLKDMNQEQIESLDLYFVSQDQQELCPDGKNRKVTQQSVEDYLQLTAKYLLYYKYERAIKELRKGFQCQFNIKLLTENFTLNELNQLIDTIDYYIDKEQLLKTIKFSRRGNFVENYLTQFISESEQQTLELFIQFITGSKFINFEQQGNKIEVQCDIGMSKQRLPTSRTCSSVLTVPHYDSYALFKMKLNQALEWGTNFFGQN